MRTLGLWVFSALLAVLGCEGLYSSQYDAWRVWDGTSYDVQIWEDTDNSDFRLYDGRGGLWGVTEHWCGPGSGQNWKRLLRVPENTYLADRMVDGETVLLRHMDSVFIPRNLCLQSVPQTRRRSALLFLAAGLAFLFGIPEFILKRLKQA